MIEGLSPTTGLLRRVTKSFSSLTTTGSEHGRRSLRSAGRLVGKLAMAFRPRRSARGAVKVAPSTRATTVAKPQPSFLKKATMVLPDILFSSDTSAISEEQTLELAMRYTGMRHLQQPKLLPCVDLVPIPGR